MTRNYRYTHLVRWTIAVSITSCVLLGSGCSVRGEASDNGGTPVANQPPAVSTEPAGKSITKDDALEAVRQQPKVLQYQDALNKKGYRLFMGLKETPSRFNVRVGEERSDKVTIVRWYLVDKVDGKVTEWKISDGEPPTD